MFKWQLLNVRKLIMTKQEPYNKVCKAEIREQNGCGEEVFSEKQRKG